MNDLLSDKKIVAQLKSRNIKVEEIISQLEIFKRGYESIVLEKPCVIGDGIGDLDDKLLNNYIELYENKISRRIPIKFVPASGAASRMFKVLFYFYNLDENLDINSNHCPTGVETEDYSKLIKFFNNLNKFAFYNELDLCISNDSLSLQNLGSSGDYKRVLYYIFSESGLNYSRFPKGLVKFHRYKDHSRTAFEEHLYEGLEYSRENSRNIVSVHFTVSEETRYDIERYLDHALQYLIDFKVHFDLSYSIQKPSTDIIAVDMNNSPVLDKNGCLIFRPGGHGALLQNLNELSGDIVFIKNIDNVVPDHLKGDTILYKKAIGGLLLHLEDKIHKYLAIIEWDQGTKNIIEEVECFIKEELNYDLKLIISGLSLERKKKELFKFLNRPLRICGVVKNEGEPGGGPFWVKDNNGFISKQIVELPQVDMTSEKQAKTWNSSTHFNPVDIVCSLQDYKGNQFNLLDYRDPNTGFISQKSFNGIDIKALELPGLWNGSMANWITVFVEVPLITFNPVKTVFDLLRNEHQPLSFNS